MSKILSALAAWDPNDPHLEDVQTVHRLLSEESSANGDLTALQRFLDQHPECPKSRDELDLQMRARFLELLFSGASD